MASMISNNFLEALAKGTVDGDAVSYKAMLLTSTATPTKNWNFRSDFTNECSGAGYTAGGVACVITITKDTVNHRIDLTITSPVNFGSTVTVTNAQWLAIYVARGGASTADEAVCFIDNGSAGSVTAGSVTFAITTPLRIQN